MEFRRVRYAAMTKVVISAIGATKEGRQIPASADGRSSQIAAEPKDQQNQQDQSE